MKRLRSLKANPPIIKAAAMLANEIIIVAFHPNSFPRIATVDRHGMYSIATNAITTSCTEEK
jgi:hypothetical protein